MRATAVVCALALMLITACSTAHRPVTSASQKKAPLGPSPAGDSFTGGTSPPAVTSAHQKKAPPGPPTGEFLLGSSSQPSIKLWIKADGTYFAEHASPIEFWPMIEGNKVYPQRVKPEAEEGHWTWDRKAGALTFTPEKAPSLTLPIGRLEFDPARPDYLVAGGGIVLDRVEK